MLSAVNKENSSLNVNPGFPHLTNTKTTTTKRDIHHLMPNDSDLSCQSELDSPELEPPSVVELELEPDDDDEPESLPEWETPDKLSGSASSSTGSGSESTSAFMTSDPIFKPKIEQRVNYIFAGQRWDRGAEIH